MNRKEVLKIAIKKYGMDAQVDMCIEECSELIKALLKLRRAEKIEPIDTNVIEKRISEVLEELADVEVMKEQMQIIFGETINIEKDKIQRLAGRLGMPWIIKEDCKTMQCQDSDWIPVSKRLPIADRYNCLVTVRYPSSGLRDEVWFATWLKEKKNWCYWGARPMKKEVIAWMPLPERYEEGAE